jgi:hypothetical protein
MVCSACAKSVLVCADLRRLSPQPITVNKNKQTTDNKVFLFMTLSMFVELAFRLESDPSSRVRLGRDDKVGTFTQTHHSCFRRLCNGVYDIGSEILIV